MLRLPSRFAAVILTFAPLFLQRSWRHAVVLLAGAILAPGGRTVTSILRIAGMARERRFVNDHRVLNRAAWCPRAGSRLLLGLLIAAFAPSGPVVLGIDDTIERRRGKRIAAKGIYRDPVRSSHGHFTQSQWAALAQPDAGPGSVGRAHLGFAVPDGAGPLGALLPSARTPAQKADRLGTAARAASPSLAARARTGRRGRQRLCRPGLLGSPQPLRRNLREAFAARRRPLRPGAAPPTWHKRAASHQRQAPGEPVRRARRSSHGLAARHRAGLVWRRRAHGRDQHQHRRLAPQRDARRPSGKPEGFPRIRWALIRDPLRRFDPQALLCTDPAQDPILVLRWFVQRWQLKVTFHEVRDHLGVETQRHREAIRPEGRKREGACEGSDKAIARTTPCLLGLFSLVTLLGRQLTPHARRAAATSTWYRKQMPTFSDTLAAVRRACWREQGFVTSRNASDLRKLRPALRNAITYALCHAA